MWDQTDQSGTIPNEFTFGTEYSREQINAALKVTRPLSVIPMTDPLGHGTALPVFWLDPPTSSRGLAALFPSLIYDC